MQRQHEHLHAALARTRPQHNTGARKRRAENASWPLGQDCGEGILLALVGVWWVSWQGISVDGAAASVRSSARLLAYLQAVAIETLSWLAAVLVVATTLLGVMLLLNALGHRLWP